jgi:hypothetical protein
MIHASKIGGGVRGAAPARLSVLPEVTCSGSSTCFHGKTITVLSDPAEDAWEIDFGIGSFRWASNEKNEPKKGTR